MKPKNYLNNKDILREIHKSKNSYSSYISDDVEDYDAIVGSMEEITPEIIDQAIEARHARISKDNPNIDISSIGKTDIVIRVMTFDHVPEQPGRKKTPKTDADLHSRCNFPPFQHYKFDSDDNLICVGKSHWVGGIVNGHFSSDHGNLTEKLAFMLMELSKRCATKGNWRGYSYNDEMRAQALIQLVQAGLQFNEYKGNNPFAYYTQIINNSFRRVLHIEKKNQGIRDDILEANGMMPSYSRQTDWDYHKTQK